jgi:hypothetical protein
MATTIDTNPRVNPTLTSAAPALDGSSAAGSAIPSAPALLPDPAPFDLSDGSMAALAMLLTKADAQDRGEARRIEGAADQAAARDDAAQVAQMRDKIGADWGQALATGIAEGVGGACSIGSAFVAPPTPGDASFNAHTALEGAGQASSAIGTIVSGSYKADAQGDDAAAAEAESRSQADIRRYGQAHEDAQAADASIQKVAQFLEQVQQTQNATQLTAATFRA